MTATAPETLYEYYQLSPGQVEWVERSLQSMDIRRRVGQLFIGYMMHEGLSPEAQMNEYAIRIKKETETFQPGGYYLNKHYFPSTPILLNLLAEASAVPLFICADMEAGAGGGFGGVIAPEMTPFPVSMAIGAAGSSQYAYQTAKWTAIQAGGIGVNFVFAPSVDVNNNPDNPIINVRAYGEDPEAVARMGIAYIRGLQENGSPASAKHFPGHGDAAEDTHIEIASVAGDRDRLERVELYPFRRAIAEARVDTVMTAHVSVPALEPDASVPATFSSRVLQDLLRDEMGFRGVVISDALLMGGVTSSMGAGEAAVRSLRAGCDILLMPPNLEEAFTAVYEAVDTGMIPPWRLEEAVRGVLALKAKHWLYENPPVDIVEIPPVLQEKAEDISYRIAGEAVTLVKNRNGLLPLDPDMHTASFFLTDFNDPYSDHGHLFLHSIDNMTGRENHMSLMPDAGEDHFAKAMRMARQAEAVVFGVETPVLPEKSNKEIPEAFQPLIDYAIENGKKTVLVSFGNPYMIRRFHEADAYVCAYSYYDMMAVAVVEALYGERAPRGRLPVTIPGLFERGTGLTYL